MTDEVEIERIVKSLLAITGPEAIASAARAAANRLLDFLDVVVQTESDLAAEATCDR